MSIRASILSVALAFLAIAGCAAPVDPDDARVAPVDTGVEPRELLNPDVEVRLSPTIINQTSRSSAELVAIVNPALRARLEQEPGVDVDEGSEPTTKRSGYYLRETVKSFTYNGSTLTAQISLTVFTYPGLTLIQSIPKSATTTATTVDHAKEDLLLQYASRAAAATFLNSL